MRRHILDLRILSLLPIRIPPSALLQLTLIRGGASSVFGQKSSIKTVFLSVYPVMRPALDLLQFMCFRSAIREKSLNTQQRSWNSLNLLATRDFQFRAFPKWPPHYHQRYRYMMQRCEGQYFLIQQKKNYGLRRCLPLG